MRETKSILSRRSFFGDVRTVGAAVAAVALMPSTRETFHLAPTEAQPESRSGYQLTEHVKCYYQSSRV
jgi:hypothetical protein